MDSNSDPDADAPLDEPGSALAADPAPPEPDHRPLDKFRIRFRKDGSLRLLSHHDLLRTFERLIRRADLPFRSTQGFNPRPRLVFALSLPLGVIGRAEVVELETLAVVPPEEVRERILRQTPPGLAILDVRRIPPKTSAHVRALCYGVRLPVERLPAVRERIAGVMAAPECWVERTRPPRRRLDIRPFLRGLHLREDGATEGTALLEMELWLLQNGTARPEEVLTVLGVPEYAGDGSAGAVLERLWLELEDEQLPSAVAQAASLCGGDEQAAGLLSEERPQRQALPPDDPNPGSVSPG
jgi:radical SAM-linked protein